MKMKKRGIHDYEESHDLIQFQGFKKTALD